jgi:hypothetical protein
MKEHAAYALRQHHHAWMPTLIECSATIMHQTVSARPVPFSLALAEPDAAITTTTTTTCAAECLPGYGSSQGNGQCNPCDATSFSKGGLSASCLDCDGPSESNNDGTACGELGNRAKTPSCMWAAPACVGGVEQAVC